MKFKEYDIVRNVVYLDNVLKGSLGTILMILDEYRKAYEVEFLDDRFETIKVMTVFGSFLCEEKGVVS